MIREVCSSLTNIGSSKGHSPAKSSAGSVSTAGVRSWPSSLLMALLGAAAAIALVAAPAGAALVTTVGDFTGGTARSAWIAGSSNPAGMVVETLDALSASLVLQPSANATSGTSSPWIPSGNALDVDLGQLNARIHKSNSSSNFSLAVQPTGAFSGSQAIGGTGSTSGKWIWLRFMPKAGTSWSDFAVDFNTTYTNERSGVGYFSYRVYFDDGTNTLGRLWDGTSTVTNAAYTDIQTRLPGTGFIGFRESNANIAGVEFFQYSNGSSLVFDNPTFLTASPVPEPSTLAFGASGLAGLMLAPQFVRRRRA